MKLEHLTKQYNEFFDLSQKTVKISEKVLSQLENTWKEHPKGANRLCILLYAQAVGLLRGINFLCEKKLHKEAAILTRSLIEISSYQLFIGEDDHEERAELYVYSRSLSEAVSVRRLNSMTPEGQAAVDETFFNNREAEALKYFRTKYGNSLSSKEIKEDYVLRYQNASEQLKNEPTKKLFLATYKMFYPYISSIAHGESPISFINSNNDGRIFLKEGSRDEGLGRQCLRCSLVLILYSTESLIGLLNIKNDFQSEIEVILSKSFSLMESNVQ